MYEIGLWPFDHHHCATVRESHPASSYILVCITNITYLNFKNTSSPVRMAGVSHYCGITGRLNPAVIIDDLLVASTVWMVSKNTRSVFWTPLNSSGVRNLSVTIRKANPTTLKIFILLMVERSFGIVLTRHNTLTNRQTAPLFLFDQCDQERRKEVPVWFSKYLTHVF